MTVPTTAPRISYDGDDVSVAFPVPFRFFNDEDLLVYQTDEDGNTTTLVDPTDYSVSGAGDDSGGTLTLVVALPTDEVVTIIRSPVIKQETAYTSNGRFPATSHEAALDLAAMISQRLNDRIDRSLRFHDGDPILSSALLFPRAAERASKFFSFDADGNIELVASIGTEIVSQSLIGGFLWPQTAGEVAAGTTPSRYYYPPGNLKRYTLNDGDGTTNIAAAFVKMLTCGETNCYVPTPTTAWRVETTITWQPGVSVECGLACLFSIGVASGQWGFKFTSILHGDGARFIGFELNLATSGCHGIQIYESNSVHLDDFYIEGVDDSGKGLELNGGNSGGTSWCAIGDRFYIKNCLIGLRMWTETGTDCNRNFIGRGHINSCTTCIDADRANTNEIGANPQAGGIGWNLGADFDKNKVTGFEESCTKSVVIHASATQNIFVGNFPPAKFVNSSNVQIEPQISNVVVSGGGFKLPREVAVANSALHFMLPNGAPGDLIRVRAGDGQDYDVVLGGHDAADTDFKLISLKFHATAPYALAERAFVFNQTTLTYSTTIATDASLGNEFVITATDGVAFAISAPTNPQTGQMLTYTIRNTSGGALGVITWNAVFKMSAWTSPATANSRSITFKYNGTNWVQVSQTGVDVPN